MLQDDINTQTLVLVEGVHEITQPLVMRPGVTLVGNGVIRQAAGANLNALLDFTTLAAHGASVYGLTLDGNRANNTDTDTIHACYIGQANNVTICGNYFRNLPGVGVYVTTGQYPKVVDNDFQNVRTMCIAFISPTGSETAGEIHGNTISNQIGQHAIYIARSNGNRITKNRIYGTQVRGTCWSDGHNVSWASGGNFAGLQSGGFLIGYPGGNFVEAYVQQVTSPTSVVVRENLPAANYTFVAGTGDLINIGNSYRNTVSGNIIQYGAGGGVVIHNFYGGVGAWQMETVIENNEIYYIGGSGVSIQSTPADSTIVADVTVQNNRIVSCGMGGDAVRTVGRNAISVIDFGSGLISGVALVNNRIQNELGSPTMTAPYYISGVPPAQIYNSNPLTYGV